MKDMNPFRSERPTDYRLVVNQYITPHQCLVSRENNSVSKFRYVFGYPLVLFTETIRIADKRRSTNPNFMTRIDQTSHSINGSGYRLKTKEESLPHIDIRYLLAMLRIVIFKPRMFYFPSGTCRISGYRSCKMFDNEPLKSATVLSRSTG
jgi:hypothetical protein